MSTEWYYVDQGTQAGPLSEQELKGMIESGKIMASTLVWQNGMAEWIEAKRAFPDLRPVEVAECAVSGQVRPVDELLQYGSRYVSPEHKEEFLQELGEGGAAASPIVSGLHTYADPRPRARVTKWMFVSGTVIQGFITALLFAQDPDSLDVNPADLAAIFISLLYFVVFVIGVVFYCMWKHRVCANAHAFGEPMGVSPGWAVGFYFIPIVHLWKPFQAMVEIWNGTFGRRSDEAAGSVLGIWWTLWIISNIGGNISFRLSLNEGTWMASLILDVVLFLVAVGLLFAILKIMNTITDAQVARAERSGEA